MTKGLLRTIVVFLMILSLVGFSLAVEGNGSFLVVKDKCPVCGMFVAPYAGWNATIEFKDVTQVTFDGPKDMFKFYLDIKKYNPSRSLADISAVSVKDYYSQTSIDARKAYFVIWSDVYGPMGHEPVPFEKQADATEFLKEHRGRKILRFNDVTKKVLLSLDNP
jgi:copper chaperone NosL